MRVRVCLSDLLAEHLQEIRVLRQRLEESIQTNDRLREQLEKRLAEVEKDPGTRLTFRILTPRFGKYCMPRICFKKRKIDLFSD